jgi:hypothetical protein
MTVRIGLDFDNTIVCYDELFPRIAREQDLVPADTPPSKGHIRDYLRSIDREDDWTLLQGYVYGARMDEADAFPGVIDFLRYCREQQWTVFIISHKTRSPYMGPAYDLHQAARHWLEINGIFDPDGAGLAREQVFFELTKEDKIERIRSQQCDYFVDDLPEFLSIESFPTTTRRILFDPANRHPDETRFARSTSWVQTQSMLTNQIKEP